jgi:predicted RNase H-like nuclease (RuvC/YqgF family)
MMENLWAIIGGVIATIVSGLSSWFFAKSKYKAEVEGAKIDNFDRAIDAYKKMYEDMIEDLKAQNSELKEEVEALKTELNQNRQQIMTLTNFVLASAIQRADGNLNAEAVQNLKNIING